MNQLYISYHNSVKFYRYATGQPVKYQTKHYGQYQYRETIHSWETNKKYFQKWQNNDTINIQFLSNFDPIVINIIDKWGNKLASYEGVKKLQDEFQPGRYAYEFSMPLTDVPEGCYYFDLVAASGALLMFSEPFHVKQRHNNTLLYEYRDSTEKGDVLYGTGIVFCFRIEGTIGRPIMKADTESYINQKNDPVVLSSSTYKAFPVVMGGSPGIPDWAGDIINEIFSCNDVRIDGKSYAKEGDTEFEINEEERYPLHGISCEVREGINRPGNIIDVEIDTTIKISVVHQLSTQIFADINPSGPSGLISVYSKE